MKKIIKALYHISGRIYIPSSVLNNSPKIIHISDTPTVIYGEIIHLIKRLNPKCIIHTGDIADDIKLEIYPFKNEQYRKQTKSFINTLLNHVNSEIIFIPGNHDDIDFLKTFNNIKILEEGSTIDIDTFTFGVAHKFQNLPKDKCDYFLFGHDNKEFLDNYLNGINNINIIDTSKNKVFHLEYPIYTDNYRLLKRKIGI